MSDGNGQGEVGEQEEEELLAMSDSDSSSSCNSRNSDLANKDEERSNAEDSDNDSESDNEEMDVDEEANLLKLKEIEDKLFNEPNSYEVQIERIQILKALGNLDKLRSAREKLNEVYPLSPELWLSWIQDEISLVSNTNEEDAVTALFERAVKDYLSIDLWLEYINFSLSKLGEEGGVEKCREIFERALSVCGLHVTSAASIWEAYQGFEADLLGAITSPKEMEEQEKRYISLCHRQLSVPLEGMELSYETINSKIDVDSATEAAYQKALEKLKTIQPWESKLIETDDIIQKTETFKRYIDSEKRSKSNPARIVCLYERAVVDLPLDGTLWLEFMDYVYHNLPIEDVVLEIATRASRNCPWIIHIWKLYLDCVEHFTSDKEKLKEIFEKAIIYCTTGENAAILWLRYIEFLRRRIDYNNVVEADVQLFNKTVSAAEDYLLQLLEEPNDFICELLLYRARVATHISKSLEETRELWSDIFQRGYGKLFRVWLQYLFLEKQYGNVKSTRKHFEKGLPSVQDNPECVMELWLSYEQDFGDLKSIGACQLKLKAWKKKSIERHERVQLENSQSLKRKRNDPEPNSFKGKKSKPGLGYSEKAEDKVDGDWKGFKVPHAPGPHAARVKNTETNRNSNIKVQSRGGSKSTDHHQFSDDKELKFDQKNNDKTAFLSNLSYSVGEEAVREFLVSCGKVDQVRLVKDFQGRSKGYAYVTFSSQEDVKRALEKDREPLEGRPVYVSEYNPDKSNRPIKKFETGLEQNKLFVKGLPFTATTDHIQALFGAFGKVTDVRFVTYRNGNSKGMAYVDFLDGESATAAIKKTDGTVFEGNVLSVAVSNPPKRASKDEEHLALAFVRRTAKPFVPRSVQVKTESKPEKPVTSEQKATMSNQEFRQFFLKPAPVKLDP